ncbi:hypothetical protein [Herbiconiux sp. YIM B11900]|uniref:hypothetical protein n=1 Tax=Herbiconiux sp. YIM B11900 TaxID=3404131 RepID=UPI003F830279
MSGSTGRSAGRPALRPPAALTGGTPRPRPRIRPEPVLVGAPAALLAIPGGAALGVLLGGILPLALLLPELVRTGGAQPGFATIAVVVGCVTGLLAGLLIGGLTAAALAIAWRARARPASVVTAGSVVATLATISGLLIFSGPDAQFVLFALLASTQAVGGVILTVWVGERGRAAVAPPFWT